MTAVPITYVGFESWMYQEWGEFGHLPGKKFAALVGIRDEIQRETDRLLGTSKVIGEVPISLYIHSSEVIDLTLIDLPGEDYFA